MIKVSFYTQENPIDKTTVEFALIENADGGFTSMLKSTYEAMQAEQSTPSVTHEG